MSEEYGLTVLVHGLEQRITELEAENARLTAIVERLPKCVVCGKPCVTHEDGGPEAEFAGNQWTCSETCFNIECGRRIEAAASAEGGPS